MSLKDFPGTNEHACYILMEHGGKYAVSLVFEDNGYMGIAGCSVYDFLTKEKHDCKEYKVMPAGRLNSSRSCRENGISYKSKTCDYRLEISDNTRHFYCKYDRSFVHTELEADILLEQINDTADLFRVKGFVRVKGKEYAFDSSKDFGALKSTSTTCKRNGVLYRGTGCGMVNGKIFGFSIGGGKNHNAENVFFYDDNKYEMGKVEFQLSENFYGQWKISAADNKWDMTFTPFFNDHTHTGVGFVGERAEKLFGTLSGQIMLSDGSVLNVENLPVLQEISYHRW